MSCCHTQAITVQKEKYYYVSLLRTPLCIIGGRAEKMLISYYSITHH